MTKEEEARLIHRVMEDSMSMYDEHELVGLEDALALSTNNDVAIPEEQPVAVKEEVHEVPDSSPPPPRAGGPALDVVVHGHGDGPRSGRALVPTPPHSSEREPSPRGEVVQAPPAFHGPPAHLWTMPSYVDLTGDDDDNGDT
ncbi:hypothetical protein D1007_52054 [Hordeum vulgare]|nr:hypothetical protein D1007_52054 [Hordeum vulgare]